jgi:hypothetical protein
MNVLERAFSTSILATYLLWIPLYSTEGLPEDSVITKIEFVSSPDGNNKIKIEYNGTDKSPKSMSIPAIDNSTTIKELEDQAFGKTEFAKKIALWTTRPAAAVAIMCSAVNPSNFNEKTNEISDEQKKKLAISISRAAGRIERTTTIAQVMSRILHPNRRSIDENTDNLVAKLKAEVDGLPADAAGISNIINLGTAFIDLGLKLDKTKLNSFNKMVKDLDERPSTDKLKAMLEKTSFDGSQPASTGPSQKKEESSAQSEPSATNTQVSDIPKTETPASPPKPKKIIRARR